MDAPLLPNKSRKLITTHVIIGVTVFCIFIGLIVGVVFISNSTAKNEDSFTVQSFDVTASAPPCTNLGANSPSGCDITRVRTVKCGSITDPSIPTIQWGYSTKCSSGSVTIGGTYNIQFYQINTTFCLEITAQIGECWGKNPINNGTYGCQGQCGSGCVSGCSIFTGGSWSICCFLHDICSWYWGASGGGSDAHCGTAYNKAASDFLTCSCTQVKNYVCPTSFANVAL